MILPSEVVLIGKVLKTHGIKGEMVIVMDDGLYPYMLKCLVMEVEGILVPFFVYSVRDRGTESWLVTIDDVDSQVKASEFVGRQIFALRSDVDAVAESDEDGFYVDDLVGFVAVDVEGNTLGVIDTVDMSTDNILFVISPDGQHDASPLLVPAVADFIADVDMKGCRVVLDLPAGLVNLN